MCILFLTREHPDYELILISNRDEFLQRKTCSSCWNQRASAKILCPYDLSKMDSDPKNFGTWCGINEFGRVATVLNLKLEEKSIGSNIVKKRSRGYLPIKFLDNTVNDSFQNWDSYEKFSEIYPDLKNTGDFNLFYGDAKNQDYRIIDSLGNTYPIFQDKEDHQNQKFVLVVSNSTVGTSEEKKWDKIKNGEQLLTNFLSKNIKDENLIIKKCFEIAATSELTEDFLINHEDILDLMTETVFVPPIKLENIKEKDKIGASIPIGEYYGTRSQIVILVNKERTRVRYIERTLYECDDDVGKAGINKPINELNYEYNI